MAVMRSGEAAMEDAALKQPSGRACKHALLRTVCGSTRDGDMERCLGRRMAQACSFSDDEEALCPVLAKGSVPRC